MNPAHATTLRKLEAKYGVRIADDAQPFAVKLLRAYENEPSLKNKDAIHLVEAACLINLDREERLLDWDEYCLDRAVVEVTELRREKSVACRTDVLPRVEEELAELTRKWDCFRNKWFKVLEQQRHESRKRRDLLIHLDDELTKFRKTRFQRLEDAEGLAHLPPLLDSIAHQLQHTVHSAFLEKLIVGPREVAQEASKLTGLPEKCFYPRCELGMTLQIEDLKARLSNKLIALDGMTDKIGHALSKQKSVVGGPLGSFLLLGPYGCGRSKLAEALAEEIYGDNERCIELDVSEVEEPYLVTNILHHLTRFKQKGYVVIFVNIENQRTFTDKVLWQIIKDGILADHERSVSFSNTIVLVSSYVGHEVFLDCQCLHTTIPKLHFREILKDPALLHEGISSNNCRLQQFCTEVTNQYSSNFLDLFNDLLVFPFLSLQNHMAISRLQTRDAALRMRDSLNKNVVLYPSDAAVVNMMNHQAISEIGAHAYVEWYQVYMRPRLNEHDLRNEAGDMLIIYIDQLVGLGKEFSFRVENGRHLENFPTHRRFKESLSTLRSIYRREKLQSHDIYRLQTRCSRLCELLKTKREVDLRRAYSESRQALKLIDCLLTQDGNEVQLDYFIHEAEVSRKLQCSLEQRDKATQAITEVLLRCLRISKDEQSKAPAASLLCLGLGPKSKDQFAESLGEYLVMDDGKQLLFQVDLSLCREPGSFFQCRTYTDLLLTEAVKRSPHSVIIFHQLEMAHMSVFSTILSILDGCVAEDSEGNITSFEHCMVVIISDLGNKEIISKLIRDHPVDRMEAASTCEEGAVEMEITKEAAESSQTVEMVKHEAAASSSTNQKIISRRIRDRMEDEEKVGSSQSVKRVKHEAAESSSTNQMGPRGLRYELLYRLDQLLLFDPFSYNQLNRFAMLPMKSLEETTHSLYEAFSDLWEENLDEVTLEHIQGAVGEVIEFRS